MANGDDGRLLLLPMRGEACEPSQQHRRRGPERSVRGEAAVRRNQRLTSALCCWRLAQACGAAPRHSSRDPHPGWNSARSGPLRGSIASLAPSRHTTPACRPLFCKAYAFGRIHVLNWPWTCSMGEGSRCVPVALWARAARLPSCQASREAAVRQAPESPGRTRGRPDHGSDHAPQLTIES